jgi:hypothetical protein
MPHWIIQGDVAGRWSVTMDVVIAAEHEVKPLGLGESSLLRSIEYVAS